MCLKLRSAGFVHASIRGDAPSAASGNPPPYSPLFSEYIDSRGGSVAQQFVGNSQASIGGYMDSKKAPQIEQGRDLNSSWRKQVDSVNSTGIQPHISLGSLSIGSAFSIRPSFWWYEDLEHVVHGPFSSEQMKVWFIQGYLPLHLPVKSSEDSPFVQLMQLFSIGDPAFLDHVPVYPGLQPVASVSPSLGFNHIAPSWNLHNVDSYGMSAVNDEVSSGVYGSSVDDAKSGSQIATGSSQHVYQKGEVSNQTSNLSEDFSRVLGGVMNEQSALFPESVISPSDRIVLQDDSKATPLSSVESALEASQIKSSVSQDHAKNTGEGTINFEEGNITSPPADSSNEKDAGKKSVTKDVKSASINTDAEFTEKKKKKSKPKKASGTVSSPIKSEAMSVEKATSIESKNVRSTPDATSQVSNDSKITHESKKTENGVSEVSKSGIESASSKAAPSWETRTPKPSSSNLLDIMREEEAMLQKKRSAINDSRKYTMAARLAASQPRPAWNAPFVPPSSFSSLVKEQQLQQVASSAKASFAWSSNKGAPQPSLRDVLNEQSKAAMGNTVQNPSTRWASLAAGKSVSSVSKLQSVPPKGQTPLSEVKHKASVSSSSNSLFWESESSMNEKKPISSVDKVVKSDLMKNKSSSNEFGGPSMSVEFLNWCKERLISLTGSDGNSFLF